MKLYTEEQLKEVVKKAFWQDFYDDDTDETLMSELTPIELPSEEEIEEFSKIFKLSTDRDVFIVGAHYVLNQIKQQDNGHN